MNRLLLILISLLFFQVYGTGVLAATQKVQVAEFSITGAENANELKGVLKNLLSSRLAAHDLQVVNETGDASARIDGSYTAIGTSFSIDASVKTGSGKTLGQRFVQGDSQNDLIPAIGRLADQLQALLQATQTASPAAGTVVPLVAPSAAGEVVRFAPSSQPAVLQTRIEGTLLGIAPGRKLPGNEREYVVAGAGVVYLYRLAESLKRVAEYPLKREGKILSIDTAMLTVTAVWKCTLPSSIVKSWSLWLLLLPNRDLPPSRKNYPTFSEQLDLTGRAEYSLHKMPEEELTIFTETCATS
jgi:hypothetical protein